MLSLKVSKGATLSPFAARQIENNGKAAVVDEGHHVVLLYFRTIQVVFLEVDNAFVIIRFRLQDCRDLWGKGLNSCCSAETSFRSLSGTLLLRLAACTSFPSRRLPSQP